jgi:spore maturation protein CgeE
MPIDNKILDCEIEYTKCFSEFSENDSVIRLHDEQLKDMYCHNYTCMKKSFSENELIRVIKDGISLALSENKGFCNIYLYSGVTSLLLSSLKYKPRISVKGFYSFDISNFSKLKSLPSCTIKQVTTQQMVEDILYSDLQHDEETLGKDFCTRRCYRRGKVYVSDKGVNSYICYDNNAVMGTCDLFIDNGIAKIEDFSVVPKYQRQGYGTTILRFLIDLALNENCHTIYLVTDEDDTAKEMYQKIGFSKIGERTDLFFRL